jgi:hypothetical protein
MAPTGNGKTILLAEDEHSVRGAVTLGEQTKVELRRD